MKQKIEKFNSVIRPLNTEKDNSMMSGFRPIIIAALLFIIILFVGTSGYIFIEGWPFLDALYMTVITLSTVGYEIPYSLSPAGKGFTVILILVGVGTVLYLFGSIAQVMFEGRLKLLLGRKAMEKKISALKNHYIICGYGRIGQYVCKQLREHKTPFVIIERDPQLSQEAQEHGFLFIQEDATKEEALIKAGVKNALGLITVVESDADNVYIILTARGLNPSLKIISRAAEEGAVKKMFMAGANTVISPYEIGARKIVQTITHPLVTDFIELTVHRGIELQMEEIPIGKEAKIKDVSLKESGLRQKFDVIVIAIRKASGEMIFNPSPQTLISCGDILIVLGKPEKLVELESVMDSHSVCLP